MNEGTRAFAVAGACLALACGQGGQPAHGRTDLRVESGTVRMTDLPPYEPGRGGAEEEEEAPVHAPPLDFELPAAARAHRTTHGDRTGTAREALAAGAAAATFNSSTSPAPSTGFLAMAMSANWPPDTNGAVGPNHVVSTTNDQIVVHDRLGNVLTSTALNTFWGASWSDISPAWDPNLRYDPYADRFIFVCMANFGKAGSSLLVAVTATSDPTGLWYQRRVYADPSTTIDHPRVGFNGKWIAATGNTLTGTNLTFSYVNLFVFDKADLYANGTKAPVKFGNLANVHTLTPALTYDPTVETLYLVSNYNGNDTSASPAMGYLALSTITGPVGGEALNLNVAFPGTTSTWASKLPSPPNIAPQAGSCPKIGVFDARMNTLVYRNGSLWATHTVFLPAAAPTIAAVDWWQVGTDGSVQQFGRITDPTGVYFYDYPSLAVNAQGDMLIGYSRMAATEYATAAYALRAASDPPGTVRQEFVAKPGAGPYCLLDGSGANRWGDYSVSQVDPVDDTQLWTMQEFAAGTTTSQWGTWWVSVPPPAVSAVLQTISLSPSTVTGGQGATGTVILGSAAPAGGLAVALSSGSTVAQVPPSVTVPAGATSATFAITTSPVAASTPVPITATAAGVTQRVPLNVEGPAGYGLAVSGQANRSGAVALNGARLSGNAYVFTSYAADVQDSLPAGVTNVCFWLDNPSMSGAATHCEATGPWDFAGTYGLTYNNIGNPWNTAAVPDGAHTITQLVTGVGGATETETATFTVANASVLQALGVSPGDLTSGQSATGTVTLSAPAPSTGLTIGLSSNNAAAQPPAAVTVPAGATSATFNVSTGTVVSTTTATVAAALGLTVQTATVTVHPATTFSVSVSPVTVTAGQPSTGTITLGAPAPAGGAVVTLSSSSAAAQVPASVTVAAGASSATFTITTGSVGAATAATISATYGAATQSTVLTITPPAVLQAFTVAPATVPGGQGAVGTVTLTGPAPPGGALATLSSGNAAAQVPASVMVPAGASSATFAVTTSPVAGSTAVILSATYGGATLTAPLTVTPPPRVSVVQAQQAFNANSGTTITAPITTTPGNLLVAFVREGSSATDAFTVSDNLGQAWKLAGYNTFSSVERCGTFYMPSSGGVTSVTASFTTAGGVVRPGIIVYEIAGADPTAPLDAGTIGTIGAGTSITSAALSTAAATDILLFAVDVSANQTGFTPGTGFAFPSTGSAVTPRQAVAYQVVSSPQTNLTTSMSWPASASAASQIAAFKAAPPPAPAALQSLAVTPSTVSAGQGSTGTVTLTAPAPAGGALVGLSSGNAAAQVPASVTVPAGAASATFAITTSAVATTTPVTLTATYGTATQTAILTVNPAPALQSVTVSPSAVTGGQGATGTVTLTAPALSGGVAVSLSSGDAAVQVPASVTVPSGATSATFAVTTGAVSVATAAILSATYAGVTQTTVLTVDPPTLQSLTVSPSVVTGGQGSTGTVTLTGLAPAGGIAVTLSSSDPLAQVLPLVTVPAGATNASFAVTTSAATTTTAVTLTATHGTATQTATLTVNPAPAALQSVSVSPSTVTAGQGSTGTVTLTAAAPTGGAVVGLSSGNVAAQVPASVTVLAGVTSATFAVTTTTVAATTAVTLTATYGTATQTATLTVNPAPPTLQAVSVSPSTVTAGQGSTGTVTLTAAAPTGGAVVGLSSGNAAAQVPASVTVLAGATSATFAVTTSAVATTTAVTLTATYGTATQTATLTITPAPALQSVTVSPSAVTGGLGATGTVTLTTAALSGGAAVALSSGDVSAQVPASVTVPAGATSATFAVSTGAVSVATAAIVSATYAGVTQTAALTVLPPTLLSIVVSPSAVTGGQGSTGTVTLTGLAPAGGVAVTLSSSDPSAQVPPLVTVLAGATSTTFAVTTSAVATTTAVTLTASLGTATQVATLTIDAPLAPQAVSVSPSTVTGGQGSTGTVTLNGPAPAGGAAVGLSSGNAAAQVPASVTVPAGATSATFAVTTSAVASSTAATLSATYGAVTQTTTLTVLPAALQSVSVSPSTVIGGQGATGTVTLSGAAPPSGAVVGLSSGNAAAQVAASVTVPAGAASATFAVTTSAVTSSTAATLSATYGAATVSTTLTVSSKAPPSVVQARQNFTGNNRQASVTVSIATTPGSLLVAFVREGSNATDAFSVTDSLGQSWTPVGYGSFSSVERCGLFYVPASGAVTSVTARFTTSGGVVRPGIVVYEIAGASSTSPLDAGPAGSTLTQNVTAITSGSLTTTGAADLLLFAVDVSNNQSAFTPGAGFAFPAAGGAVDARQAVAYRAVTAPQAGLTTSMTWPSGAQATTLFAAFR